MLKCERQIGKWRRCCSSATPGSIRCRDALRRRASHDGSERSTKCKKCNRNRNYRPLITAKFGRSGSSLPAARLARYVRGAVGHPRVNPPPGFPCRSPLQGRTGWWRDRGSIALRRAAPYALLQCDARPAGPKAPERLLSGRSAGRPMQAPAACPGPTPQAPVCEGMGPGYP